MMGTGKTWAKVCPGCGQPNSVHALWCVGCEQMLPITTMVELEAAEPETEVGGEGASDSDTTMEEHSAGQVRDLSNAAPPSPEPTFGEAGSETDSQLDGNTATSSAESPGEARHDCYTLVPPDPERSGCLSLMAGGRDRL
jgi:hypothetical protein